jgi:hypothetical protein
LGTSSISCVVGDVACSVGGSISWRIGRSISCGVGSGIDGLHHFVFTSSLFRYWLKGTIATTSLVRMLRSAPGIRACIRSTVSKASFFYLSGGDAEVGLETSHYRSVFELT